MPIGQVNNWRRKNNVATSRFNSKGTILDEDNELPIGTAEVFRGRWTSIGHLFVMRRREFEFTQVSRAMVYEQPFDEENRVVSDCRTADISHHFTFTCVSSERDPPFSYYFFSPPLFFFAFFLLKYSPPLNSSSSFFFFFVLKLAPSATFFFFEIREPIVSENDRTHHPLFSHLFFLSIRPGIQRLTINLNN